jgi:CO/xanthine dehydrogenase FAD-binding subunit
VEAGSGAAAMTQALSQASPISDIRSSREYRLAMMQVMTRRTLVRAFGRLDAR